MAGSREGSSRGDMNYKFSRNHSRRRVVQDDDDQEQLNSREDENAERRTLRVSYRELQHTIQAEKEEIGRPDSRKFTEFVSTLNDFHERVQKPREQIFDAEVVLDVTKYFVDSIKDARRKNETSPATFVGHIIRRFGLRATGRGRDHDASTPAVIDWGRLGIAASGLFKVGPGVGTMLGPMDIEPKAPRARAVRQIRNRPTECSQAEEVKDRSQQETNAQTDSNMETMFRVLKRARRARLDALVLNRESFSQTVENIFSLSFLVKDGRVSITYDEDGEHLISPKNAPSAEARASGETKNSQFVFRLDWSCWLAMIKNVPDGFELMPGRSSEFETPGLVGNSRKRERDTT